MSGLLPTPLIHLAQPKPNSQSTPSPLTEDLSWARHPALPDNLAPGFRSISQTTDVNELLIKTGPTGTSKC